MLTKKQYLVIGGTGKTGARVLTRLKAQGHRAKSASRHGEVHFDWNEPTTWSQALKGTHALYLTYYPDLAAAKAPEDISRFCTLARLKGVEHITVLSGRNEPAAQDCENIIKQSGMHWTIVRAAWFNQNFSEGLFRQFVLDDCIALPVVAAAEPFVDADDIADVVTASLTDKAHRSQLYEVTGPELITFADIAVKFSQYLNRKIAFESITLHDFQSRLAARGVDDGVMGTLTYLFSEVLDGRSAFITHGVEKALGRPPVSFDRYIQNNLKYFTKTDVTGVDFTQATGEQA